MPDTSEEFLFPHEDGNNGEGSLEVEIEESSALELGEVDDEPIEIEEVGDDGDEIEIVDDTPPDDQNWPTADDPEEVTDEELKTYSKGVQQRIKKINRGYHDQRREKEKVQRENTELDAFARRMMADNKALRAGQVKNQETMLEQAKTGVDKDTVTAKAALKEAIDNGDSEKIVEAQSALNAVNIRADRIHNFKPAPLQDEEDAVELPPSTTAPVADVKANTWQKDNAWFGNNSEMTSLALGVHDELTKRGVNPQSDEYYTQIDARMRKRFPEEFDDDSAHEKPARKPGKKRAANVVAAATRTTAPRKVVLTRTAQAIAKRMGLTLKQYAEQVVIDQRNAK